MKMRIRITGCVVSLYYDSPKNKTLYKRLIASPEWVSLWYLVQDNKFDDALWLRLSDRERQFMALAATNTGIDNGQLHHAVAEDTKEMTDQLHILEGELLAGNLNSKLVDQYDSIIDKLTETGQLPRIYGSKLKKSMKRTYEQQVKVEKHEA